VVKVDEDCKINLPRGSNVLTRTRGISCHRAATLLGGDGLMGTAQLSRGAAGEDVLPRACDPEGRLSSEYRGYQP